MKKNRCILAYILSIFLLLPTGAWAAEDIQASLIQGAVYKAKAGDPYSLELGIVLPKDYEKKYTSIATSIMLDSKLEVVSEKLEGVKLDPSSYKINHTKLSQSKRSLVTFSVSDLSALKGQRDLKLTIQAKIASGQKDVSTLENSYVLSYMDKAGVEGSFQKDVKSTPPNMGQTDPLDSGQKPETSPKSNDKSISIEPVVAYSNLIKGKAMANANIQVFRGQTPIAYGKTKADGSFEIVMNPQPGGVSLRLEFVSGREKKVQEIQVLEDSAPSQGSNGNIAGMDILTDYLEAVSDISRKNLSKEQSYQLEAAISMAKYFSIKEKVSEKEVALAIDQLKDAYKTGRIPYMLGLEEGKFGPQKSMTRGEVAVALAKTLSNGKINPSFSSFKDVSDSKWYAGGVGFMEKNGLISGYTDKTFRPENTISRGEFAAIVAKYLNLTDSEGVAFKDVKKSAWNASYIGQVAKSGVMTGGGDGKFRPEDKISRQEVATVINKITQRKVQEKIISKYGKNPFSDVDKSSWAYYQIMEVSGN